MVCDEQTEKTIWWDKNGKLTPAQFDLLHQDFLEHAKGKQLYVQDLYGGADPKYRIKARVFTELAWHSLFIRTLLIRPERSDLSHYVPDFTILCLPSFKADPKRHGVRSETVIAINFTKRMILIGGTYYAGEMKKSVFTTLNYYLPAESVMPMHCSANVGRDGDVAAVLRPVRHRQDHAVGRSEPHPDRRRRARLGPAGRVQFRGRLLRQVHQAVGGSRARDLCRDAAVRLRPRKRRVRSRDPHLRLRRRLATENTRSAYPLDFIPTLRAPAAPACRRTSCCSPPTPLA